MKCIVSGGTGFIGRKLVESLRSDGHYVAVWSRHPGKEKRAAVEAFFWDPAQGEPAEESLNDFDAVVHLAGEPVAQRWTDEVKQRIRDSRVLGTRHLVDAIAKVRHRPSALICASAIGFYGPRGDEMLDEQSPAGKGYLAEVCQEWEREADRAQTLGLRVLKMRIGIALGSEGGALKAMLPAFRAFAGGTLGTGRQWMSWIQVDDLVAMFRRAVEGSASGVWNGTAPNPATNAQFTAALGKALGRPAFLQIPPVALRALFGEMADSMVTGARVLPKAAGADGFTWKYPDLESALRASI